MTGGVRAMIFAGGLLVAFEPTQTLAQEGASPSETSTRAETSTRERRQRENAEVIRLAEQETTALTLPGDRGPDGEERSLGGALLQMILVLGGVSLLAYLLLGKVLPKIMRVPSPTGRPRLMRIVDRLPVDQRRSILLVAIGEDYFLVGSSDGGLELISRLDADTVRSAEISASTEKSGIGRFAEAFAGRNSKEP